MKSKVLIIFIFGIVLLSLIGSVSAITYEEVAHGQSFINTYTQNTIKGWGFTVYQNYSLLNVTKEASATGTTVRISTNAAGSDNLGEATFTGNLATFSTPINLTNGTEYFVLFMNTGTFDHRETGIFALPDTTTGSDTTWRITSNGNDGVRYDGSVAVYNFVSVGLKTRPNINLFSNITTTLISPSNNIGLSSTGTNFTVNYTTTNANLNLTNATYYVWYSNGTIFNNSEIVTITGTSNSSSNFIDQFTLNSYLWNVYACGDNVTGTQCSWASSNFSFDVGATVNSIYQKNNTFETSYEIFETNITLLNGTIFYASKLNYNGTLYDATINHISGNNYQIIKGIDIPLSNNTQQNKTWYWNLIYEKSDGSFLNQNLSSNIQTINFINISNCVNPTNTTLLNFTTWNEEDSTRLTPYDFYGTFNYWLGSGSVIKNVSFSNMGTIEKTICSDNSSQVFHSDATVQYEKTNYVKRSYYLVNNSLSNTTQHIKLFLLNKSISTSFIIDILDQNQLAIQNAYIYIQRYYPGTGVFNTVEMAKTNKGGSTIGHFEAETEDYKLLIQKQGVVIYESEIQKIFCRETPCTLTFQTSSAGGGLWSPLGNLSNFIYSLAYNETTKIWKYTYVDTSGTTHYGRLYVYYENPSSGEIQICNLNSTATSSTLLCNVTGYNGTIYAKAFISRSPEILVYLKSIAIKTLKTIYSKEGLFLSMLILMVLAFAGIWNPAVGILLLLSGIIIINFIGIASFGMTTIIGLIFIGSILLWKLKT